MSKPTKEDQELIARYIHDYGYDGYGLCYVLGSLRAQGLSTVEADQLLQAVYRRTIKEDNA